VTCSSRSRTPASPRARPTSWPRPCPAAHPWTHPPAVRHRGRGAKWGGGDRRSPIVPPSPSPSPWWGRAGKMLWNRDIPTLISRLEDCLKLNEAYQVRRAPPPPRGGVGGRLCAAANTRLPPTPRPRPRNAGGLPPDQGVAGRHAGRSAHGRAERGGDFRQVRPVLPPRHQDDRHLRHHLPVRRPGQPQPGGSGAAAGAVQRPAGGLQAQAPRPPQLHRLLVRPR
jgi:hypothetical protein